VEEYVAIFLKLFEENERLKAAGSTRTDPSTWRPDLTKSIDEYRRELGLPDAALTC
jgi:hypothetical protein